MYAGDSANVERDLMSRPGVRGCGGWFAVLDRTPMIDLPIGFVPQLFQQREYIGQADLGGLLA